MVDADCPPTKKKVGVGAGVGGCKSQKFTNKSVQLCTLNHSHFPNLYAGHRGALWALCHNNRL